MDLENKGILEAEGNEVMERLVKVLYTEIDKDKEEAYLNELGLKKELNSMSIKVIRQIIWR